MYQKAGFRDQIELFEAGKLNFVVKKLLFVAKTGFLQINCKFRGQKVRFREVRFFTPGCTHSGSD